MGALGRGPGPLGARHSGAPRPSWASPRLILYARLGRRACFVSAFPCRWARRPFLRTCRPPAGAQSRAALLVALRACGRLRRGAPAPRFAAPLRRKAPGGGAGPPLPSPPLAPVCAPGPVRRSCRLGRLAARPAVFGPGACSRPPCSFPWWSLWCGGRGGRLRARLRGFGPGGLPALPPGAAFGPRFSSRGAGRLGLAVSSWPSLGASAFAPVVVGVVGLFRMAGRRGPVPLRRSLCVSVGCPAWRAAVGGPRRPCGRQSYTESAQCWSSF